MRKAVIVTELQSNKELKFSNMTNAAKFVKLSGLTDSTISNIRKVIYQNMKGIKSVSYGCLRFRYVTNWDI